jgi:hypothetical protein
MARKNNAPTSSEYYTVTPLETGELIEIFDKFRRLEPVRKCEPDKVAQRLNEFFKVCSEYDIKPTVELMSLALGVSRKTLWQWQNDEFSESGQLISGAKELINALLTQLTMQGKCNPVYSIWLQKNNFHYADTQQVEVKAITSEEQANKLSIDEQVSNAGLIWDDSRQEFIEG